LSFHQRRSHEATAKPFQKFSPKYLDEMAVHMAQDIRDLPASSKVPKWPAFGKRF
jgi:hypothetical protein